MADDNKSCPMPRDPIAVWDNVLDLVADDDALTGKPSEQAREWSRQLDARIKSRVAELRRRLTPTDVEIQRDVPIPPAIQVLDRNAIVAQLELERKAGNLRWAHHELTGLSDDTLRITLALAMAKKRR